MEEILGTIYTEVSEDFQRGIYPIARCIKAEKHDLAVVTAVRSEDVEVKQIGNMDDDRENFSNPQCGMVYDSKGLSPTINTCQGGQREPKIIVKTVPLGNLNGHKLGSGYAGSVYDQNGLAPTINTMGGGNREPMVLENICINDRGFSEKEPQVTIGVAPTLRAETHGNLPKVIETQCRIRKLTPLECWRLMGFSDDDFHKAEKVNSNSQLYKQAGNSIVNNVLMAIFGQMMPGKENVYKEL